MGAGTITDRPFADLLDWFEQVGVEYEIHEHVPVVTARETAEAEGVDPSTFAKVVGVRTTDERTALIVLDATDRLDLHKARRVLESSDVRLLTEPELHDLAPGCELGAMPAVGRLFNLPTYADHAVRDHPEISFNAGNHRFSARVDRAAWERACGVVYVDVARRSDRPAWDAE